MAYTTPAQVKRELTYNYQKGADKKLTEDGYVSVSGSFDETAFLTFFINQTASFIDAYLSPVGRGPFVYNGMLDKINKSLATYEIETYLVSASSDRVVSVSIFAMYKQAMVMLDKIVAGDLILTPESVAADQGTVRLIEPDDDGATLDIGDIEEFILLGGSADSEEIPE